MRKISITLITCLLFFTSAWGADFELSATILPRATIYINSLYDAIIAKQDLAELGYITLTNNTIATRSVVVRVQLYSKSYGTDPLADIRTLPTGFPIILPPESTKTIYNTDFDISAGNQLGSAVSSAEIQSRFYETYGTDIFTKYGGMMPDEIFTYKVYVFAADGSYEIGNELAMTSESIEQPLEFGNIQLLQPADKEELSLLNPYPSFAWQALNVREGIDISYHLRIWEIVNNASYEETKVNETPVVAKKITNETTIEYPTEAPELKPDTEYIWLVEATDNLGYPVGKGKSPLQSFKMAAVAPPNLLQPLDTMMMTPVTFKWQSVDGADYYKLTIDNPDDNNEAWEYDHIPNNEFTPENDFFEPGKTYEWQVQAYTVAGLTWGKASDIAKVKYDKSINLISPVATQILSLPVEFYFTGLSKASSYSLEISRTKTFAETAVFQVDGISTLINAEQYAFEPESKYYWRVIAKGPDGANWGNYSEVSEFETWALSTPLLISPIDIMLVADFPEFQFQKAAWATTHVLELSQNSGNWDDALKFTVDSSSFSYPETAPKLRLGTTYYWRVLPYDEKGETHNKVSEIAQFQTRDIPALKLQEPVDVILNSFPVSLVWQEVFLAAAYRVLLSNLPDFSESIEFETEGTFLELAENNFKQAELITDQIIYWAVEALDSKGIVYGKRSHTGSFKLTNQKEELNFTPDIVAPLDKTLDTLEINLRWLQLPEVTEYRVLISSEKDMGESIHFIVKGHEFSSTVENLVPEMGKQYYWQVQAILKSGEYGPLSLIGKFQTPILKASIITPKDDVEKGKIVFKWNELKGASGYILSLGASAEKLDKIYKVLTNSYPVENLGSGKYFWQVQAINEKGLNYGKASKLQVIQVKAVTVEAKQSDQKNIELEKAGAEDLRALDEYIRAYFSKYQPDLLKDISLKELLLNQKTDIPKELINKIINGEIELQSVKVKYE